MSFVNCVYHIVFATYRRQPFIIAEKEREVYALIYHILEKYGCHVYRIGGMPEHVHLLIEIPPTISVSTLIQNVKRESSLAITQYKMLAFWEGWQKGYGCFSCGITDVPAIVKYITTQKEHHRHVPFIEEYRAWLIKNGVSSDELPFLF